MAMISFAGFIKFIQAQGYGVAYFAKRLLADKGMSLEGKKCIVTGSNYVSLTLSH